VTAAVATRMPWGLLIGLTALNVLNFADRYLLLSFSPRIIADLQLSHFQFTLLTGFVFTLSYSLFGLAAGVLADRLHRSRLIAAGVSLWSLLTAATGFAGSFGQMAAARAFVGVGEAVLTPSALTLISDYLPPARRSMAIGVYYLALPLGIGASYILAAEAGAVLGWRGAFMLMGLLGVFAALWMLAVADPLRGPRHGAPRQRITLASFGDSARELYAVARATPAFPLVVLGAVACVFVQGSGALDLVWWIEERGYDEAQAQRITGGLLLGGGIAGAILGGVGADFCQRRMHAGRLKFLLLALLLAAPLIAAYRFVSPGTALFHGLAFAAAMASALAYGPAFATVQDLVPASLRGTASGFLLLCSSVVGASGGSAAVGLLSDLFRAQGLEQPISQALQLTMLVGVIAFPAFFVAIRRMPKAAIP